MMYFDLGRSQVHTSGNKVLLLTLPNMDGIKTAVQYLTHRCRAKRWDAFHSPYLFELFVTCCAKEPRPPAFEMVEQERQRLRQSSDVIPRIDLGAGSKKIRRVSDQKIADIASHASSLPFQCRFLARLVAFTQAKYVLELGTSLGLSAAYMASMCKSAHVVTIEGDPAVAGYAKQLFEKCQLGNITLIQSGFERYLTDTVANMPMIDVLFLDGHHQQEALLAYYGILQSRMHTGTIVVVDDIHWSTDMFEGWQALINRPEVTQSVDAFHFGVLFFNPDFMAKENHMIRFPLYSLWK